MELTTLAAAELTYDAGYFLGLLSRIAHTTCAATLLGGLIFLRFVLAPAQGSHEEGATDDSEAALFAGRRASWAKCVALCTLLLLVSGFYNFFSFMGTYKNLPKPDYHLLFGIKFVLALGVMTIMALVAGKTSLAQKVRGSLTWWLNVALVLALSIYVAGAMLRSMRDLPDARVAVPQIDEAPAFGDDPIELEE